VKKKEGAFLKGVTPIKKGHRSGKMIAYFADSLTS
jgi:hypothetical protein